MYKTSKLNVMSNEKRALISCLKQSDISLKDFGQIYCIKLNPKTVAGDHFHKEKEEWLIPIAGKMKIYLEDVNTKKRQEVVIDADNPEAIRISPQIAHAVENISESQSILLEYAGKPFNPSEEDKFFYKTSPA